MPTRPGDGSGGPTTRTRTSGTNPDDAALASTAFVINGTVQSAPVTAGPITGGKLMIAGTGTTGLTKAEAEALAAQLS